MNALNSSTGNKHIAVVGGGVAGATAAIHFSELGYAVTLIEKGPSLVNGPPICHLHAGGNLYREISTQQCIDLLKQSIDSVRLFPASINIRPTIIAVPRSDAGEAEELLPRLAIIREAYRDLVREDARNQVLGEPDDYFKLYSKADLARLARLTQPEQPKTFDDWCIPFAKNTDLEQLKYPVIMVAEYGWSVFRLSAIATLALERFPASTVMCNRELQHAQWDGAKWQLDVAGLSQPIYADYLINACGFETGELDDVVGVATQRMVEFKAAYVTQWQECHEAWPEVIFHGERGTPDGMAQLTPYADGYFQLHGMTEDITLFEDGLVAASPRSAQPKLPAQYVKKIRSGWDESVLQLRTQKAIEHAAKLLPAFISAKPAGKALFGAQQIPGRDATLRAADVSFSANHYACIEIVKGSSTLLAAQKIALQWFGKPISTHIEQEHPVTCSLAASEIESVATSLAKQRGYPVSLAQVVGEGVYQ
ncbi:FAD-dependent oxidoreductase [Vibrio navarrensis]